MATATSPLFALEATGSLGKALTFSSLRNTGVVRSQPRPGQPRSPAQQSTRAMISFLGRTWGTIPLATRADWTAPALAQGLSAYNFYIRYNMQRWSRRSFPTQSYPATEAGTMGFGIFFSAFPYPRRILTWSQVWTVDDAWGIAVYRALTFGGIDSPSDLVYIISPVLADMNARDDYPLTPGQTYFYAFQLFSTTGKAGPLSPTRDATPTT